MPRIAITLGDPAGIGPEVVRKALQSGALPAGHEFLLIGDEAAGTPRKPDARSATASFQALKEAAAMLNDGRADAVVTAPVSKAQLQSVGFTYPGQTEFFAAAQGITDYGMCLSGDTLTVALATIHEPLAAVPSLLTVEGLVRTGKLLADFLSRKGDRRPRIAVAGLNPHAGEGGAFGDEEIRIISPAIEALNALGIATFEGPGVPDAIFRDAARGQFDGVLAMYHDQGLIPLKLLDFDTAVNVTLGLPKPRTSPDHGTAFGIAGQDIADASSMIRAIRLACEMAG
ncbi:4-hydroxythreonine-4-phosphate dehydrogenase PdxA [Luteolibacter sp. LG18]|uniref:4-hydroxythreonine-4-phosphate dehydrogenase PdxA n=1 Tax=Luteolibacter sp. LG18 TaxID=2819286 RepID=UPI002B28F16C|nr:4-hydroxythreonine-4-phosphate dehydrogenase [Luteolibacter sp. LG18]